jgi:GNAT superfamily N-acetyltransferase
MSEFQFFKAKDKIGDLASTESERSKGPGEQLLTYAEKLAQEMRCKGLRLSTGIDNELGKKFCERHNWKLRAAVYKMKLGR